MAEAPSSKRLALDTNVLLDRANQEAFAIEFIDVCQQHGFQLCATYTVLAELDYISKNATADEQAAATTALNSLRLAWDIEPIEPKDVELNYRKNFVEIVAERQVLPPKEINDARIIAETAIAGIRGLVTSDRKILDASAAELRRALDDAGLTAVIPVSPQKMLEKLR